MVPGTDRLRRELAGAGARATADELVAAVRLGAELRLRGGQQPALVVELRNRVAAVPRRVRALAMELLGVAGDLVAHEDTGVDRRRYGVEFPPPAGATIAVVAGLADAHHRLLARPSWPAGGGDLASDTVGAVLADAAADRLRGALLAAGTLTAGRDARVELPCARAVDADVLAADAELLGIAAGRARGRRPQRLLWYGPARAAALARVLGAPALADELDDVARRRELRAATTRLANADDANLRRSVAAARRHVASVAAALAVLDDHDVPDELQEVALARLANPALSLAELGELLDPPRSRSAVLRRLQRLESLAREATSPELASGPEGTHDIERD